MNGTAKYLFDDLVSAEAVRKLNDIDLGIGKKLFGFQTEEH